MLIIKYFFLLDYSILIIRQWLTDNQQEQLQKYFKNAKESVLIVSKET
jgi:hypothetical protein